MTRPAEFIAVPQRIEFEQVIELMHAEEAEDMRPRKTDLFIAASGKRVPSLGLSIPEPSDFLIERLDLINE